MGANASAIRSKVFEGRMNRKDVEEEIREAEMEAMRVILRRFSSYLLETTEFDYDRRMVEARLPPSLFLENCRSKRTFVTVEGEPLPEGPALFALQTLDLLSNWLGVTSPPTFASQRTKPFSRVSPAMQELFTALGAFGWKAFSHSLATIQAYFMNDLDGLLNCIRTIVYSGADLAPFSILFAAPTIMPVWRALVLYPHCVAQMKGAQVHPIWFKTFIATHLLAHFTRSFSIASRRSLGHALNLAIDRMQFLAFVPKEVELCGTLGYGSAGMVSRISYRGRMYALKSVFPLFEIEHNILDNPPFQPMCPLDFLRHLEALANCAPKQSDPYWRWLKDELSAFLSLLLLPRPGFVQAYHCYIGNYPGPPRYYCPAPRCFHARIAPTADRCPTCHAKLRRTLFGQCGFHVVMELAEGGSLQQLLDVIAEREEIRTTRLPFTKVLEIMLQIAASLAHNHASGIAHRDLKPASVLFKADGRVLLTDIGLSTQAPDTGPYQGSLVHKPPEMHFAGAGGARDLTKRDIWALGVICLEMLGCTLPGPVMDPRILIAKAAKRVPSAMVSVLYMMLAVAPEKRASAVLVLNALERIRKETRMLGEAVLFPPCPTYMTPSDIQRADASCVMLVHLVDCMHRYDLHNHADAAAVQEGPRTEMLFAAFGRQVLTSARFSTMLFASPVPKLRMVGLLSVQRLCQQAASVGAILALDIMHHLYDILKHDTVPSHATLAVDILVTIVLHRRTASAQHLLECITAVPILPLLIDTAKANRDPLLRQGCLVVIKGTILCGLSWRYYSQHLHGRITEMATAQATLHSVRFAVEVMYYILTRYSRAAEVYYPIVHHVFDIAEGCHLALRYVGEVSAECTAVSGTYPSCFDRYFREVDITRPIDKAQYALLSRAVDELILSSHSMHHLITYMEGITHFVECIQTILYDGRLPGCCALCGNALDADTYSCTHCIDLHLCGKCHRGSSKPDLCGLDHEYIPVELLPPFSEIAPSHPTLLPSFMGIEGIPFGVCPKCCTLSTVRSFGSNAALCVQCGYSLCATCLAPWETSSEEGTGWKGKSRDTILHMIAEFKRYKADTGENVHDTYQKQLEGSRMSKARVCTHGWFEIHNIFKLTQRCVRCGGIATHGAVSHAGVCGHRMCNRCMMIQISITASSGDLIDFGGKWSLPCPQHCKVPFITDLDLLDGLAPEMIVEHLRQVSRMLEAQGKQVDNFRECSTCQSLCILGPSGQIICAKCSFPPGTISSKMGVGICMEGTLFQRREVLGGWKKRYFYLEDGVLCSSQKPRGHVGNTPNTPRVVADLNQPNIRVEDGPNRPPEYLFRIRFADKDSSIQLLSDSIEVKRDWMAALRSWN